MPYDDKHDEYAPAMAVQHMPMTRIDSKAQPLTFIALNEGCDPFETPADVTRAMKEDLRDILYHPKNIHLQATPGYKTASVRDLTKFV